ncbi:MAG: hypothetical protein H0X16_02710 [Chloroflexi bacterium]|nr:hypothetical protein [Chloroflexota bacterium]
MPALRRLFALLDERERAYRVSRRALVVEGSMGQPRINPVVGLVATLDAEIRQLEDRLSLTPKARMALGVAFGEAHRSLDALNAEFLEQSHD